MKNTYKSILILLTFISLFGTVNVQAGCCTMDTIYQSTTETLPIQVTTYVF